MRKKNVRAIVIRSFALLVVFGAAYLVAPNQAMAQDATTAYPNMAPNIAQNMAPIEQYLMMDQGAEIALARSAAPESISRDAEVLVLGRHGFETAAKGKNGFVCLVERSWTSAAHAYFWNPKVRTPICYNAAAARSLLPRNIKRTDLILAGRTKAQTDETIVAAVGKKELPAEKAKHEAMTEGEQNAMFDTCFEYDDHLRANGHWAGGEALQPAETALTLYWRNGKVATTDGPYAETKEQLGGILVLEARDMNHAVQLIAQHPAPKYGSIFEIRPAADLNEMMKASQQRRRKDTSR